MLEDPIIEELHRFRAEWAAEFNYDLKAIVDDLRRRQQAENRQVVSLPPKRVASASDSISEGKERVSESVYKEKATKPFPEETAELDNYQEQNTAQGAQIMSIDIGSLIVRTPGTVGGRPRIAGTRVTVRSVAICYKQGDSPEEIALRYEHLTVAQVYAALTYYHANQAEIEADIAAEESLYDKLANEHKQAGQEAGIMPDANPA